MGDLPDWTQATSNAGTVLESGAIGSGAIFDIDVSNNNSLVINASGALANTKIVLTVEWFTDSTKLVAVNNQVFTSQQFAAGNGFVGVETPVYGGYLEIQNNSGQAVTLTIIGSSRIVSSPRLLSDTGPGRIFAVAGSFVSGTGVFLLRTDVGPFGFISNGSTQLLIQGNTPGSLYCQYVDWAGIASLVPIASFPATGFLATIIALPQAVVAFAFIPTANNAAGTITVNLAPAQL